MAIMQERVTRRSVTLNSIRESFVHICNRALLDGHDLRLVRFGLVGMVGIAVNTAVLFVLVKIGGLNHIAAAGIGSEVSIIGNFALNDRWTFAGSVIRGRWLGRLFRYNAVALCGMTISLGVLAILMRVLDLHYLLANLVAIGAATGSNYILNVRFTWAATRNPATILVPIPVGCD